LKAIFGIGNPGNKYAFTRHNIGFILLDQFALKHKLKFKTGKGDYYFANGILENKDFILIKPTTFVNNSGFAASEIFNHFKITEKNFLVVTDDVNLSLGKLRIRNSGGHGGHNGLYSIIYELGTENFPRLRFGIGNNFEKGFMAEYVLSPFPNEEWEIIQNSIKNAVILIESFIVGGLSEMLNRFSKISSLPNSNNFTP